MKSKKILGIDYGDFTIGLAVFIVEQDFIFPYKTIWREKANILRKSLREIIDIIIKENITTIVVGLPLNMDDTKGDRVNKVETFVKLLKTKIDANDILKEKNINVEFQDERLTTKEAEEILLNRGLKKIEHKKVIDQVAAEIILQDYKQKKEFSLKEGKCQKKLKT